MWSFRVQEGERVGGYTYVEEVLSEFVKFQLRGVSEIHFTCMTTFNLNCLRRAPSSISTYEYSADAPFSVTMRLMLPLARIKAFRPTSPHSCWFWHCRFKQNLLSIYTQLSAWQQASFRSSFNCSQFFLRYPFITSIICCIVSEQ